MMGPVLSVNLEQYRMVSTSTNLSYYQPLPNPVRWISKLANNPERTVHPEQRTGWIDKQTAIDMVKVDGLGKDFIGHN